MPRILIPYLPYYPVRYVKPVHLPVVMESLELYDQGGGEALDAHALHRVPLLGALLAEVGVVALQQLSLHVLTESQSGLHAN